MNAHRLAFHSLLRAAAEKDLYPRAIRVSNGDELPIDANRPLELAVAPDFLIAYQPKGNMVAIRYDHIVGVEF